MTAFTDGCPGLRSILVDAGITTLPILDWFHIAMRMQHATQTASGLPTEDPGRMQAKSVIVEEVERLRWRIWNGKAKNAKRSIDQLRQLRDGVLNRASLPSDITEASGPRARMDADPIGGEMIHRDEAAAWPSPVNAAVRSVPTWRPPSQG